MPPMRQVATPRGKDAVLGCLPALPSRRPSDQRAAGQQFRAHLALGHAGTSNGSLLDLSARSAMLQKQVGRWRQDNRRRCHLDAAGALTGAVARGR